jgi:prepilin-type N-terminal cleavage/methylation domain-containing protein
MTYFTRKQGFTLVEVSIVLVVIGLIVGGVIAGRSMIRQSQVMSVTTDVRSYISAVQTFLQKYNALPGDMATATNYWGYAGGAAADTTYNGVTLNYSTSCYSSVGTGTKTCNGNGNGQIADGVTLATPSYTYADEEFRAWQHLANAGLIQGSFTGAAGSVSVLDGIPGTNLPASRLDNAGYSIGWIGVQSGAALYYDGSYGHIIGVSGRNASLGAAIAPILSVSETISLDVKFDDGLPGTGNLTVNKPAMLPNCSVNATTWSSTSSSAPACYIAFITGF